jgi:hypothetical protein
MPIYLADVLKNPELLRRSSHEHKCCSCKVPLQETITGKRKLGDSYACSDCYYEALGLEIEERAITSGGVRRG